jgi:hypothetical protein
VSTMPSADFGSGVRAPCDALSPGQPGPRADLPR